MSLHGFIICNFTEAIPTRAPHRFVTRDGSVPYTNVSGTTHCARPCFSYFFVHFGNNGRYLPSHISTLNYILHCFTLHYIEHWIKYIIKNFQQIWRTNRPRFWIFVSWTSTRVNWKYATTQLFTDVTPVKFLESRFPHRYNSHVLNV